MMRFVYPAALAVLALLTACSGDAADDAPPTPTASPTPGASPLPPTPSVTVPPDPPEVLSGVPVEALRVGEDLSFPFHHSIVTLLGCTNCDGPAYGIGRIYRDETSVVVVEALMWTNNIGLGIEGPENSLGLPDAPADQNDYAIIGAAADATGSEIIAGVCCVSGDTVLYRSTDGGVTWVNYLEMAGTHSPLLIVEPGQVLTGTYAYGGLVPYQIVPRGDIIEPPEDALWPAALLDGKVAWIADGGESIRTSDGVLIDAKDPGDVTLYAPVFGSQQGVMTIYQSQGFGADYFLATLDQDYSITRAYRSPDAHIGGGFWLDDRRYLTMAPFLQDSGRVAGQPYDGAFFFGPLIPTIVDMGTGEVHSITDTWEGSQALSARGILSLRTGSLARVTGTGSCLNVRAEPTTSSEVLACTADNVLLTVVEPDQTGPDWLHVITPDGVEGFVSRDYVEVIGLTPGPLTTPHRPLV